MRTHYCGHLNADPSRPDRHPLRLGPSPPRPRRRHLHRPARPRRPGPGRVRPGPPRDVSARRIGAQRIRPEDHRQGASPPRRAPRTPTLPCGEIEILCHEHRSAQPGRHAALPARRREPLRERAPDPPRHRPAPSADAEEHDAALQDGDGLPPLPRRQRLHRHRNADADQESRRRAPATTWCRRASIPASSSPCRSRRNCSSSC